MYFTDAFNKIDGVNSGVISEVSVVLRRAV